MKLVIGADHGGFELKESVSAYLSKKGYELTDVGCYDENSVDYPDIAVSACEKILSGECELGILICGTGIGISIAANKTNGIRAALCSDEFSARATRAHNNSNVLCLGGRVVGKELANSICDAFLSGSFEGGRHERRVAKLAEIEEKQK